LVHLGDTQGTASFQRDLKSKMAKLIQQREAPGLRKGLATGDTNTTTRERLNFAKNGIHRHQFTT